MVIEYYTNRTNPVERKFHSSPETMLDRPAEIDQTYRDITRVFQSIQPTEIIATLNSA